MPTGKKSTKKNPAAVALGRKGGLATAKNLTRAERTAIGRKAARARWAKERAAARKQARARAARAEARRRKLAKGGK
jgi:hypothetical protein